MTNTRLFLASCDFLYHDPSYSMAPPGSVGLSGLPFPSRLLKLLIKVLLDSWILDGSFLPCEPCPGTRAWQCKPETNKTVCFQRERKGVVTQKPVGLLSVRPRGVRLGVCTPRCLSVQMSWGCVGRHVGWRRSPYVGCLFWSYSCAPNSSLALRVEKLGPCQPSAPPSSSLSLLRL